MIDASWGELAWLVLAVVAAGVLTGLLAGVFGIGGGAVIVPVLYELFRLLGVSDAVRMQLSIGTSLAIIIPTAWRSYRAHKARGAVIPEALRLWTVPLVVGVLGGSAIAAIAQSSAIFKLAFVAIAAVIVAKMWFISDRWHIAEDLPGPWAMRAYGFAIGLGSSLMGISGGSPATLVLTLYNKPIHRAVATSAGIGMPLSIAGAFGYMLAGLPHLAQLPPLSLGFVSLIGVAAIAPLSAWTAPFGARLAHALPQRWLEIAFGGFLVIVASRFVASLV
ncbi:MAG TPA: sulfite exporter TauE/SafE family protein [Stellaceae bacterium]|nr:sulfite exporter TauE/SafE family protein [Stellaceae bacterium]